MWQSEHAICWVGASWLRPCQSVAQCTDCHSKTSLQSFHDKAPEIDRRRLRFLVLSTASVCGVMQAQSSSRLCSRNPPLPSAGEASSDVVRQFKSQLIQVTTHVTKFNVRDRTRLARFSVVNCGTGRQFKRADQPSANRDLLRISDLNTERSVIDARLVERQRDRL